MSKTIPIRTCIVCNSRYPKRQMLRLIHNGKLKPDTAQKADGRGRYICSPECAEKLLDIKRLRRAFRMNLTPTEAETLLKALTDCGWATSQQGMQ